MNYEIRTDNHGFLNLIKKTLRTIKRNDWEKLFEQIYLFIKNIVKYRNFSFNLNSKRYWNYRLSNVDNFWRNENYGYILDLFPKDKEFSVLDVGCAIGDGCELLQKRFPKAKITGIDISDIAIKKAKQKNKNIEYFILDILESPIPKTYDYITIIETLEHFNNPFIVVDRCLKSVKEAIIISVPYSQYFSGPSIGVNEHRYSFNEATFKNYNSKVIKITQYVKATEDRCIIYEIVP